MNRNHSPISLATIRRSVASSTAIETGEDVKSVENMLENLSQKDYNSLLKSGMFWEKYPLASGSYFIDVVEPNQENKMEIDIRVDDNTEIGKVRFGNAESDVVELFAGNKVYIAQEDNGEVMIEDIDNLILALQKAKELWGE